MKVEPDPHLVSIVLNFSENTLDVSDEEALSELLAPHPAYKKRAVNGRKARKALKKAQKITAAEDFEQKLAQRIEAIDDSQSSVQE